MPIKRHKALINLSRDHYSGLLLASVLKRDTPHFKNMPESLQQKADYVKLKYKTELQSHFKAEEDVLFPFIQGRTDQMDALIIELVQEHRILELKITEIDNASDLVLALDAIGRILEAHIRKEERQLFQLAQENISEEELSVLEERLVNFNH